MKRKLLLLLTLVALLISGCGKNGASSVEELIQKITDAINQQDQESFAECFEHDDLVEEQTSYSVFKMMLRELKSDLGQIKMERSIPAKIEVYDRKAEEASVISSFSGKTYKTALIFKGPSTSSVLVVWQVIYEDGRYFFSSKMGVELMKDYFLDHKEGPSK